MAADRTEVAKSGRWTWYAYRPGGTGSWYLEKRNGKARVSQGKFASLEAAKISAGIKANG